MAHPQPGLRAVPSDLPVYPIGRDERLDGHSFVKWWYHRWTSSRTFKLASWEAQGMARALFDMAQSESPVGTIPADNDELAVMLRTDARRIVDLRRQEFGPFRGWRPCLCDGETRLMHPVVLEQVRDAIERRDQRALSGEELAARKRLQRLRDGLKECGLVEAALRDPVLMRRMDEWLAENWKKRRGSEAYGAVILHARRQNWF
ncbi:hypothetical protein [Xinfangfangia pollutisoli]|uniref:hypothetical protein n=1 Tax=Xinfangfangia pollutisoli TaxID=2865960 RepID=UPI001CD24ABA|nr:hypothetical protein [Xinfangfangia pollutisoli]